MTAPRLKIVFMGTPDFAVAALDAIVAAGHDVVAVYAQPPRPAGRGHKLQPSPVQKRAEELGLRVRHPLNLKKDADARADFAALQADVAVVAAYGLILPQEVLDAPRYGCINIHASLLPRWRGAAPIQRAILAGDTQSGVCIMQMEAGLDTGPVLLKSDTAITNSTTAQSLHDDLATLGAGMIVDALADLPNLHPAAQPEEGVTYAHMLSKDDGRIDWTQPAVNIERQMRALTPWPGVWTRHNGARLKIIAAEVADADGKKGKPGEIIGRHCIIACGTGSLKLTTVQPENRKPMDGLSYMNGTHASIGDVLGGDAA